MSTPRILLTVVSLLPVILPSEASAGGNLLDIIGKHCEECHSGPDAEEPELSRTTNLKTLLASEHVVPGSSDASGLVQRVSMDPSSRKRMPKSSGEPGDTDYRAPLSVEEIQVIREWIDSGGVTTGAPQAAGVGPGPKPLAGPRVPVSEEAAARAVADDLARQPVSAREHLRYLTLVNLHNDPGVTDAQLVLFRKALSKLLNSLSWNKKIVRPEPVDSTLTVHRFDLRDRKSVV